MNREMLYLCNCMSISWICACLSHDFVVQCSHYFVVHSWCNLCSLLKTYALSYGNGVLQCHIGSLRELKFGRQTNWVLGQRALGNKMLSGE